ncbi:unnamed protein product [Rotaria sp. Silwood2]|nr:unnamed protein product [Rotaria sp. Silwood2]CAF2484867.1 unnamed protein product [Rotaria sp. Silwood2]CAF2716682.1 unnamed protein product [Rotaria sp. Silwood2]CAF2884657.1 unnamed protein product [Rotaria sp. Silwood2]CAF4067056.1 unnamed protein product [Rotaria sp. Silwood2]
MGNDVKSRLHLPKKHDRAPKDERETGSSTNPGHHDVDKEIMKGPNRARAADSNPSDFGSGTGTVRDGDTGNPTNTARGRP